MKFLGKKFRVGKSLYENLYGLGSGSGPSQCENSDPGPDQNRPDPQHCFKGCTQSFL
jgi:hypothetical protein